MNKILGIVVAIALVAAAAGGSFYYGTKVGENRVLQNPAQYMQRLFGAQGGGRGQFFAAQGTPGAGRLLGGIGTPEAGRLGQAPGGGTMGTVEEIRGAVVILSTDNGTVNVSTSDTTLVEKYMSVDVGELVVGERVIVSGSTNADGSIAARSIQSLRAMPVEASAPSR